MVRTDNHACDEVFHGPKGALTFRIDEETIRAETGTTIFVPGGVAHTSSNPASVPATYLLRITPARFEQDFVDRATLVAEHG